MRKIQFYRTTSGYCPVEDFLDSLSGKEAQKVAWVLQLIEELDIIPTKYFKKLIDTNAIWEVKIKFGSNCFVGSYNDNRKENSTFLGRG